MSDLTFIDNLSATKIKGLTEIDPVNFTGNNENSVFQARVLETIQIWALIRVVPLLVFNKSLKICVPVQLI